MNTRTLILALAAAFSTAAALPALAAERHFHSHAVNAEAFENLTLDSSRKWKTDAPLRSGMQEIRDALASAHGLGHDREISPAQYRALGMTLERNIASIVMNCKLEPAADAHLHVIIGELNAAADAFKSASAADAEKAMRRAAKATEAYGKYFDHPGWKALEASARPPLDLSGAVELIGSVYPGRVVAAAADAGDGARQHYHVDLLLPGGNVVRFDVDAETRRIDNREPGEAAPRRS